MCNIYGDKRYEYENLVGKHEVKRPLVKPEYDLKANIKINETELGCGDTDLIELAQDGGHTEGIWENSDEFLGSVRVGHF